MVFRVQTQNWDDEDWDILEAAYTQHIFRLVPSRWQSFTRVTNLTWQEQIFANNNSRQIPSTPGIYAFCVEPNITDNLDACFLMYFGKAINLRRRYGQYLREIEAPKGVGRPSIKRLKYYKTTGYLFFHFATIDPLTVIVPNIDKFLYTIEDSLIAAFAPPINAQIMDANVKRVEAAF